MVYVVTKNGSLLRYEGIPGKLLWLSDCGDRWFIYQTSCNCKKCVTDSHQTWVAHVYKSEIVSIGFDKPIAIEGALLTSRQRLCLAGIYQWLINNKKRAKYLNLEPLRLVAGAKK